MKIEQLSPVRTPFKVGKKLRASSWASEDVVDSFGDNVRRIFHYDTLMCEFVGSEDGWWCGVLSVGIGSVSDQNGMNTLLRTLETSVRYYRDGGRPRYSQSRTGRAICCPND